MLRANNRTSNAKELIYEATDDSLDKKIFGGFDNEAPMLDTEHQNKFDLAVARHLGTHKKRHGNGNEDAPRKKREQQAMSASFALFVAAQDKTAGTAQSPKTASKALRATWEAAWARTSGQSAAERSVTPQA
jgi:hypothetical protein